MKQFLTVAVLLTILALQIETARAGDWPQWRYDAARSAKSPDDLPDEMSLRWTLKLPQPRPAWPASQRSLRFDTSYSLGHMPDEEFEDMVRSHGLKRVLFGSDEPWADARGELEVLGCLDFTPDELAGILGRNTRELLGL